MDNSFNILLRLKSGLKHRNLCPMAENFVKEQLLSSVEPSQDDILSKLISYAEARGADVCQDCPFRKESSDRIKLIHELWDIDSNENLPLCICKPTGMRIPKDRSTISRLIKTIPPPTLYFARNSENAWEVKYGSRCVRTRPDKINEGWAIDSTELDLYLWDNQSCNYRRPWAVVVIDLASNAIIGSAISFTHSSAVVQEAFCRAACITVDSPYHGLPLHIISDHGSEYTSNLFLELMDTLQIDHRYIRIRSPWSNPIERTFETIERRWMRRIPGFCGGRKSSKYKENPSKLLHRYIRKNENGERLCLLWDIETFAGYWFNRVIPEFNTYRCRGKETPIEKYSRLSRADTPTPSWAVTSVLLSPKSSVPVRQDGIRFGKNRYDSPVLKDYIGQHIVVYGYEGVYTDSVCALYKNKDTGVVKCLGEIYKAETLGFFEEDRVKLMRSIVLHNLQIRKIRRDLDIVHTIANFCGTGYEICINYIAKHNQIVPFVFTETMDPLPKVPTDDINNELLKVSLWMCRMNIKIIRSEIKKSESALS